MRIRDLIARCIQRMREGACATCDNQAYCPAGRWQSALNLVEENAPGRGQANPFGDFLEKLTGWIAQSPATDDCFARRVENEIVPLLARGDATAEHVARQLGLSRQTLFRRLRDEGTSFQQLLDAKRRQLAIRYIGMEGQPIKVVAWKLGFSGPAAFTRAFKRWTGTSPGRFAIQPQARLS